MGGFNEGTSGGSKDHRTSKTTTKLGDFIRGGGVTGAVIRSVVKSYKTAKKKSKQNLMDYEGQAAGVTRMKSPISNTGGGNGRDNNPQGIELAKASTTSATILGPKEIQKEAANTIKGPTTTEMTADQILLANKRKGRKITNITGATGLAKKYTLSKKTLLG
jgi:hypothetical protein